MKNSAVNAVNVNMNWSECKKASLHQMLVERCVLAFTFSTFGLPDFRTFRTPLFHRLLKQVVDLCGTQGNKVQVKNAVFISIGQFVA
jgi:hypothetical protein